MRSIDDARQALRKLFKRRSVVDLATLYAEIGTRSRMTVFRRLKELGYRTSFTHAGRFYALVDIPEFDDFGLWFYHDVGFSCDGTLKNTVAAHVERSPDGRTHAELQHLLRVRVQNTLLDLLKEGRIARVRLGRTNLYVSTDAGRACSQMAERHELTRLMGEAFRVPTPEDTIEVLSEALQACYGVPEASVVAARMAARGLRIEPRLVQHVFDANGLIPGKKKPESPS